MDKKITLTQAAKLCGRSRQRIHKWLSDNGKLDECERYGERSYKRKGKQVLTFSTMIIPLSALKDAPFFKGGSEKT